MHSLYGKKHRVMLRKPVNNVFIRIYSALNYIIIESNSRNFILIVSEFRIPLHLTANQSAG